MTTGEKIVELSDIATGTAEEHLMSIVVGTSVWTPAEKNTIMLRVNELYKLQGLSLGNPMTVTPTTRNVDNISLTISGDGTTTTTVERDA